MGPTEFEVIRDLPIFSGIEIQRLKRLLDGAQLSRHEAGTSLFKEGQYANFFGYVISGAYKLTQLNDQGDEIIMHIGVHGEALGIMATMEAECCFPFDAIAMGESQFLVIPRRNFRERWIYEPQLMLRYQSDLQGRIFRSHDEKRLQTRPLPQRIADLLLYLVEHKATCCGRFDLPITRREVAAYVGATVESVIRVMSVWSRQGIIKTYGRCIEAVDRERLLEIQSGQDFNARKAHVANDSRLARLWQSTGVSIFRSK